MHILRQWPNRVLVRFGVAVSLLIAVVALTTSPTQMAAAARSLDSRYIAFAVALMPLGVALQWWKWRALLLGARPEVGEGAVLRSLLAGLGLGLVTPGRLGEVGRGVALPGLGAASTTLALVDRLLSSAVTIAAGLLVAGATLPRGPVLALVAALLAAAGLAGLWLRRSGRLTLASGVLGAVPARGWITCAVGAVLFNLVFFTQLFLLVRASGPVDPAVALAIPGVFAIKTLLPVSFMDLGVREGAAVFVLGPLGVSAAAAVQAGLLLFAINVLLPGLVGLLTLCVGVRRSVADPLPGLAHVR